MKTYIERLMINHAQQRNECTPYQVGLSRLQETPIAVINFTDDDIEFIGECAMNRKPVTLCRVGNDWGIFGRLQDLQTNYFQTHGYEAQIRAYYVIYSDHIKQLRPHYVGTTKSLMDRFECKDTTKPVAKMDHMELFAIGVEKRPHRRKCQKMSVATRIEHGVKMDGISKRKQKH